MFRSRSCLSRTLKNTYISVVGNVEKILLPSEDFWRKSFKMRRVCLKGTLEPFQFRWYVHTHATLQRYGCYSLTQLGLLELLELFGIVEGLGRIYCQMLFKMALRLGLQRVEVCRESGSMIA